MRQRIPTPVRVLAILCVVMTVALLSGNFGPWRPGALHGPTVTSTADHVAMTHPVGESSIATRTDATPPSADEMGSASRLWEGAATTRIRVVDRERRPAPDAEVRLVTREKLGWRGHALGAPWFDVVTQLRSLEVGERVPLDLSGYATIPRCSGYSLVIARKGSALGAELIGPDDASVVVRMFEDTEILFEVIDPSGQRRPDIPVAVQQVRHGRHTSRSTIAYATAAPGEPYQRLPRAAWVFRGALDRDEYRAVADVVARNDSGVPIDHLALPTTPLRLNVEDVGAVRVVVRCAEGREDPSDGKLIVRWGRSTRIAELQGGEAVLPNVSVQPALACKLRLPDRPEVETVVPGDRPVGIEYVHPVTLEAPGSSDAARVGDVLLVDLSASGLVVDPSGEPVEGALVTMRAGGDDRRASSALSDEDGRFSLRSSGPFAWGTLSIRRAGFSSIDDLRFENGAELSFTLDRRSRVAGRFLVDDGVPLEPLSARFSWDGGATTAPLDAEGFFASDDVAAGVAVLEVRVLGMVAPAYTVPSVLIGAHPETTDLGEIDLRNRLTFVNLEVIGHDLRPIRATVHALGHVRPIRTSPFGRVSIVGAGPELRLLVENRACIAKQVVATRGRLQVQLLAAPQISIQWQCAGGVPAGYVLTAQATPTFPVPDELRPFLAEIETVTIRLEEKPVPYEPGPGPRGPVGDPRTEAKPPARPIRPRDRGDSSITVPMPGRYLIRCVLAPQRGSKDVAPRLGTPVTVDVLATGNTNAVDISIDPRATDGP